MDKWRKDISDTLTNLMPYAFMVDGNRIPMDQQAFDEALGYVNEHILLTLKRAFKVGYARGHADKDSYQYPPDVEDFVADRAFERWRHE